MMTTSFASTLLETSQIAPPPGAAAEQSLPLTFIDINWLTFHPIRRLIFYEFPCSKPHFLEAIVPKLKHSLSLTLKHFFPLSAKIVYPLNSGEEEFLLSWASISKLGGEEEFLLSKKESLPVFDRKLFKYPKKLDSCFWNQIKEFPLSPASFPLPTNRVRATYVLNQSELEKLKSSIQSAAYVWSCLAKSNSVDDEDRLELFLLAIDTRARLDPPVPSNYFANCLAPDLAKAYHRELVSDAGVFAAAEAVAKAIRVRVSDKKKILEDAENWIGEIRSARAQQRPLLAVSGSARVDLYGADFGWGKARKIEVLSIDGEKYAMSLSKSREFEGGLEIGMSLPKVKMEAFAACFVDGLKKIRVYCYYY